MGKQQQQQNTRSKKTSSGKGKVTPVQIAFIVDRYLSDNNFVQTRSAFRNEASHLIAKSPVNEAPRSLLSLGDMLDEYICLKEQKVILNQDKSRLDHEKSKVQNLLKGMQDVMNTYNNNIANPIPSSAPPAPIAMPASSAPPPVAAANFPVYHTPVMMSASRPSISISQNVTYSTPMTTTSQMGPKKRKNSKDVSSAPSLASKRSRAQPSTTKMISQPSGASNTQQITPVPSTSPVLAPPKPLPLQGSSVAKCLFNPAPQTPSPSTTDKSVSPADNQTPPSMNKKTVSPQQQFMSTNRTVITSETIQVSPMKQVSYYSIERNHCISSPMKPTTSKRFSTAKGRLDFDGSEMTASDVPTSDVPASDVPTSDIPTSDENTTGSPSEDDAFDFDLPNLDCLADFNLTELLGDFDDGEGLNYFCQTDNGSSPETLSGSPDTVADGSIIGDHELISGMSSTVTEIRSEQDMNAPAGPNSVTSMRSVTKCIKVFSPVKSRKSTGSGNETCDADQVV
ncbi:hypothetical protein CTI12_AA598580 [Artemisia annua]|uniref:Uncharacterized protein n=1 Tax=Artemisia annua TaxID=35608 RepID=A0A2U1KIK8_ARTAN|nr:hypothetical protein CTI12_AA598580 [Artemisia annua]